MLPRSKCGLQGNLGVVVCVGGYGVTWVWYGAVRAGGYGVTWV